MIAPDTSPLFRSFPDPLVSYRIEDGNAVVSAVNTAFENVFGVQQADVVDDALSEYLPEHRGDGDRRQHRRITVETGRDADDKPRRFSLRHVSHSEREETGYLVFTEETSADRRARAAESRAERAERLASVAAHDLRNPLEVAKIRLEAAHETGETEHFEKVEDALDRIQQIVRDVLAVGGRATSTERVSLADVARAAWSTVDTADATLDVREGLPTVVADVDHLRQLFENLFRNAVEHAGPDVTVTVGATEEGFFVGDDGPGVPPADRDSVLDPGYSTAEGNTGLGLAIVAQIADAHEWRLSVGATESGGARFAFSGVDVVEAKAE
ncbi:Signal transduction histidine kinase [Halogranum amylolyticum]|uniref:histidine kinase n=1 Tax=Halogranum amylolyticum TaxID=660520 RepID=A0A1H8URB6_9EURY|nr:HAMP domain-containing sensor histidine kinase [Halogranum amylolyticum]SEP05557.1 Signal transduction histidine kinase [Halogranum amylolyticum]